jgi:excisionase family DNA binding protein
MREIMTPQQVAEYLQVNTDSVYRLIRQQKLAASRVGRVYRIPKEDVERFLVAHSSRSRVRSAAFRQVLGIAERNPGLSSDDILDELESMDEKMKRAPTREG